MWPADVPAILRRRADVALVFDDGATLPANREVLCIHSRVLEGLLGGSDVAVDPEPGGAGRLPLPGEDRDVWLTALRFVYGSLPAPTLLPDDVAPLLRLAHKFDAPSVAAVCGKYIASAAHDTLLLHGLAPPSAGSGRRVWQWLPLAAACGLDAAVQRMMEAVHSRRIRVRATTELGAAAEPLARYFVNINGTYS